MALSTSISIYQNSSCKSFNVYETTGEYNAVSNDTGYGGTNFELTAVQGAYFSVTLPNGTVVQVDLVVPITTLPSSNSNTRHVISNTDLGYTADDSLPDGLYTIQYVITFDDPSSLSGTTQVICSASCYFYCQVKCCVDKIIGNLSFSECCEKEFDMYTAMRAYVGLRALRLAIACNKNNKADKILSQLQKLCLTSSCNC